eukprot:scaffold7967_cov75-Cylindrotheca_fusiformis.AAC.3
MDLASLKKNQDMEENTVKKCRVQNRTRIAMTKIEEGMLQKNSISDKSHKRSPIHLCRSVPKE